MGKQYGIVVIKKDRTAQMLIHDLPSESQAVAIANRLAALRLKELRPADDLASPPVQVWEYDEYRDGYRVQGVDLRHAAVGRFEAMNVRTADEYGDALVRAFQLGPH